METEQYRPKLNLKLQGLTAILFIAVVVFYVRQITSPGFFFNPSMSVEDNTFSRRRWLGVNIKIKFPWSSKPDLRGDIGSYFDALQVPVLNLR